MSESDRSPAPAPYPRGHWQQLGYHGLGLYRGSVAMGPPARICQGRPGSWPECPWTGPWTACHYVSFNHRDRAGHTKPSTGFLPREGAQMSACV